MHKENDRHSGTETDRETDLISFVFPGPVGYIQTYDQGFLVNTGSFRCFWIWGVSRGFTVFLRCLRCFWLNPRAFVVFLVPLGSFQGWWKVSRSISRVFGSTYLVPSTLTGLQAGQYLAFYSWYPRVPLLQAGSLKVPRLSSEWHNDKICILFICRQKGSRTKPSSVSMWRMERWLQILQ